ncbi:MULTISPECIES: MmgE/PrpD family protein [unclassified Ruminococcus]|uniref:MmgE/PrpD family protein n=1 Tax=unclassified Ruminococcus TaxID=2608920 RepID=UPI00210D834C|nr:MULTISPECIES: MmgE/PrpD family protein [unclassified Ruminococcus]MCQ4022555.1 MmgE/PrpD family protein [Ruminococcus sp. zg-924]MCQ4114795.1 MmgE/PrpD family protein [Ruminococcus sp. zg-921]
MSMEISAFLSEKVEKINRLSDADINQLRLLLLDFFAAAFAGYKQNTEFNKCVRNTVFAQGGTEESSVLMSNRKIPARAAAFMNSLYGHGAELDDGNKKAMGHVGVHIIPAVLALAESEKKKQDEILTAIAAGYEVYIRISSAAQPGMVDRSFHSTGMAGAPACAAACAKLIGLDAKGIESAMALACTMSSGLLTYSESRQMIKPINPAKAAETGVFAARLAKEGVKGPLNCLEGPHGWFKAVTEKIDETMITDDNSGKLLIHDCYFKLYPSCRHTHCGIEAAINLHRRVSSDKIKKVQVNIYPNAIKLAGQIRFPKDADETKFSIHYTLACALLYGEYGVDYMNPPKMVDEVISMIQIINLIPDETMENRSKGIRGTKVTVFLEDDSYISETVSVPKGDPEKPLQKEDIIEKLKTCAKGLVDDESLEHLISCLTSFGQHTEIDSKTLFFKE